MIYDYHFNTLYLIQWKVILMTALATPVHSMIEGEVIELRTGHMWMQFEGPLKSGESCL